MQLILGNSWGLLGLLGIPAVLAIHLLQRQSRPQRTTTLFLLRHLQPESRAGRRLERLRNSLPLWLQLLTVLLLTWLLVDPRWLRPEAVQRVAVVLDSSLSMEAFRDGLGERLQTAVAPLAGSAAATEWHILESDIRRPALYSGRDLTAAMPAVADWHPRIGSHDLRPALGNARRLVGADGLVIFVSDTDTALPPGALLVNVGQPFANVGFAGLRVIPVGGVPHWEAIVRNYSAEPQRRTWWVESEGAASPPSPIELAADGVRQLRGPFPGKGDKVVLHLGNDRFTIDDALPIVKPRPKPITVVTGGAAALRDFYGRLTASIPDGADSTGQPDILIDHYPPTPDLAAPFDAVYSLPPTTGAGGMTGAIVAENHPLVEGLNWQSLLLHDSPSLPSADRDEVLVWAGARPLILLRPGSGGHEQLILNFDLETGNAIRQPAVVLLIHRFVARRRSRLLRPESRNVEQNQLLTPTVAELPPTLQLSWQPPERGPDAPPPEVTTLAVSDVPTLRAPIRPGYFAIRQGDQQTPVLAGAIHFADTREADFSKAGGKSDDLRDEKAARDQRRSSPDPLAAVWLLAAVLLPGWCWHLFGRPEDEPARRTA